MQVIYFPQPDFKRDGHHDRQGGEISYPLAHDREWLATHSCPHIRRQPLKDRQTDIEVGETRDEWPVRVPRWDFFFRGAEQYVPAIYSVMIGA